LRRILAVKWQSETQNPEDMHQKKNAQLQAVNRTANRHHVLHWSNWARNLFTLFCLTTDSHSQKRRAFTTMYKEPL